MRNFRLFGKKPSMRLCAFAIGATMALSSLTGCSPKSSEKKELPVKVRIIFVMGEKTYDWGVNAIYNYYSFTTRIIFTNSEEITIPTKDLIMQYQPNSDIATPMAREYDETHHVIVK